MPLLEWDATISVGLDILDEEHKNLVAYINRIYDTAERGEAPPIVMQLFKEMTNYARSHFKNETELFMRTNYPDKEAHISEHESMLIKLLEIENQFSHGYDDVKAHALMQFLIDWLLRHTQEVDAACVPYIKESGLV